MRILQIAYHYPPMGSAGVQRSLKFSKYLPEYGIQPVVLAAHEPGYLRDASLLTDLPQNIKVTRIEHVPLLSRLRWNLRPDSVQNNISACNGKSVEREMKRTLRDVALKLYASAQFPDDKVGWARKAFACACEQVRSENIDLVFSTAPPYSAHWLAAKVAATTGVPWIADCRDLWTDNPGYAVMGWRKVMDRRMEAALFRSAAGIVTVTPSWKVLLEGRYGAVTPVAMIPNGYDEDDFQELPVIKSPEERLTVAHVGSFYGHQSPRGFLEAVDRLLQQRPDLKERLAIRFVGAIGHRFDPDIAYFDASQPNVLVRTGYLSHEQALAEMCAADVLLLIVGGGVSAQGVLPGKIFEYLRANRVILFIGPRDGDAASILRQHSACVITDGQDIDHMVSIMAQLIDDKIFPKRPSTASPQQFERRVLTAKLTTFLHHCLERKNG